MGNEEYKEIMCELYKFLRDKISISLGEYLNDKQKEKLFSFEPENNIVIDNEFNRIIKYSFDDDKIHVSDEFLTPEYIDKIKSKNPDFNIDDLKNKINAEDPKVLLEELIIFSNELKIQEKDIIKSLFIQEVLKMLIMGKEMDPKEEVIMCGTIELLAHNIGSQNGFLVSTPKKLLGELEVAISLKRELEDKFEEIVLSGNILDYLSRIENKGLIDKIDELTDNRKIIESTQNLNNVIDSIANMAKEMENEVKIKKEEVEDIVNIDETMEFENVNNTNKGIKTSEVSKEEKSFENIVENKDVSEEMQAKEAAEKNKKSDRKAIFYVIGFIVIVLLGILVGWLLFKFK